MAQTLKRRVRLRLPVGVAVSTVLQSRVLSIPPTLGRRVYPSAISAKIHGHRHARELQRGMQRPSARSPFITHLSRSFTLGLMSRRFAANHLSQITSHFSPSKWLPS